jgi:hypothetical protein
VGTPDLIGIFGLAVVLVSEEPYWATRSSRSIGLCFSRMALTRSYWSKSALSCRDTAIFSACSTAVRPSASELEADGVETGFDKVKPRERGTQSVGNKPSHDAAAFALRTQPLSSWFPNGPGMFAATGYANSLDRGQPAPDLMLMGRRRPGHCRPRPWDPVSERGSGRTL